MLGLADLLDTSVRAVTAPRCCTAINESDDAIKEAGSSGYPAITQPAWLHTAALGAGEAQPTPAGASSSWSVL